MTQRWTDYVFANGTGNTPNDLMGAGLSSGSPPLYVLGVGFDPRCLVGLREFLELDHQLAPKIMRIEMAPPGPATQPTVLRMAAEHLAAFNALTGGLDVVTVPYPTVENPYSAGTVIARGMTETEQLADIGHLIIDISSMPSTLFFPAIKAALRASDLPPGTDGHFDGEIQIVVCENPQMDANIRELGISGASFVGGFRPRGHGDADPDGPTIWVPVLGENAEPALRAIHTLLEPNDICPVLPFPAVEPRRADALVLEHQTVLFEAFKVRASDFVYSDERNPFDLYRALCRLERDYRSALDTLGPTMVVLSAHGSKLLSVGMLLAAYERTIPIAAAAADEYEIVTGVSLETFSEVNQLCCLWLAGAPYR